MYKLICFLITDPGRPDDGNDSDGSIVVSSNGPVTEEDRSLFDYVPMPSDWPDEEQQLAIDRIANGVY